MIKMDFDSVPIRKTCRRYELIYSLLPVERKWVIYLLTLQTHSLTGPLDRRRVVAPSRRGDWKRETGKPGTVKNTGMENTELENPAPTRRGGKRRNKLYGQPMGQFLQFTEI